MKKIAFLQDIQDSYAILTGLTILITDGVGKEITDLSGQGPFGSYVFDRWQTPQLFEHFSTPMQMVKRPTLIDTRVGMKIIISPIRISDHLVYYVIAGSILDQSKREFVHQYIQNNVNDPEVLLQLIDSIPVLSEVDEKVKLKQIGKMTEVVREYLDLKNKVKYEKDRSSNIVNSLDVLSKGQASTYSLLKGMASYNQTLDFYGVAYEQEQDHFKIETISGNDTSQLEGVTFSTGEGFLGHAVAAQQFQFWKNIRNDPRTNLFTQHGMEPRSLFCIPISANDAIKGIFFGGSYQEELEERQTLEEAKILSALFSIMYRSQSLTNSLQNHLMELSTFNELFRVITTVKDMKRVLYILVDISINLIRGPFASIVFKSDQETKVEVVSRGLTSNQIKDYCNEVAKKVLSGLVDEDDVRVPKQEETSWGTNVLEFPLMFDHQLYGILCVGYTKERESIEFQSFLSSLAVAGGVAIHLLKENNGLGTDDYRIDLLHKVIKKYNLSEYEMSIKINGLVKGFADYRNMLNQNVINQASYLAVYDENIVKEYISNQEVLMILKEFRDVMEQKKAMRIESELIAIVYLYFYHNESLQAIEQLKTIDGELKNDFYTFINQQSVIVSELEMEQHTDKPADSGMLKSHLKKDYHISSREQEVLNYVLKGFNNREIASKLFISDHTVKNHMTNILQKLDVSDRSQAIAKVYQMGYSALT